MWFQHQHFLPNTKAQSIRTNMSTNIQHAPFVSSFIHSKTSLFCTYKEHSTSTHPYLWKSEDQEWRLRSGKVPLCTELSSPWYKMWAATPGKCTIMSILSTGGRYLPHLHHSVAPLCLRLILNVLEKLSSLITLTICHHPNSSMDLTLSPPSFAWAVPFVHKTVLSLHLPLAG